MISCNMQRKRKFQQNKKDPQTHAMSNPEMYGLYVMNIDIGLLFDKLYMMDIDIGLYKEKECIFSARQVQNVLIYKDLDRAY